MFGREVINMKNNVLKKIMFVYLIIGFLFAFQKVYGITENFKFVIDTIGVPRYNVYGKELNEEIYKAYNVFAYGIPEDLSSKDGQRWKDSKYGLWSKGQGAYVGNGIRGEYNLLGRDYSGNIINNYYFPVDTLPDSTPEYWWYYPNPGAKESWQDKNKYKYVEQLEYMKTTKLLFNDISSKDNSDNPEKIKEYNINAQKIGLDRARLDVCSTWKTNGIIHTRRRVGKQIRYAVFLTRPMAANADIKSNIEVANSFVMKENEQEISIEIPYGANIINMTGYANKNHIKEIKSTLYINGKEVNSISGSKISTLSGKYVLKLSREELALEENNIINVLNKSYAHTEFAVDGLMQDEVKQSITLQLEKEKQSQFKIEDIRILEKENSTLVVRPLTQCKVTKNEDSLGLTEAGKNVAIKLSKNSQFNGLNINDIKVYIDESKIENFDVVRSKNDKNVIIKFKIPMYINSTIYGWKSLRQLYGNYFNISLEDVGKRISVPHALSIILGENNDSVVFDTIDDYITNLNYKYVQEGNDLGEVESFEKWCE